MPDTTVQLPDGRTLVIPENTTPDQIAALRNKMAVKYADPKTGRGMERAAGAKEQTRVGQPVREAAAQHEAQQAKLGERMNRAQRSPTPFTNAISAVMQPEMALRSLVGGKVLGAGGGALAARIDPKYRPYGELAGNVVGSLGAAAGPKLAGLGLETPSKLNLPLGFKVTGLAEEPPPNYAPDFVERDATKLNTEFAGEERPTAPFERDATRLNEPYAGEEVSPPLGSPDNPGWVTKLPDRIRPSAPPLGSPENPGWNTPLSSRIQTPKPLFEPVSSSPNQANQRWLAEQGQPVPVSQSPNIAAQKWQTEQLGTQESPAGWSSPLSSRIPVRTTPFGLTSTSTSSSALAPGGPLPTPAAPQQPFSLRVGERAGKAAKASPSAPEGVSGSVGRPNRRMVLLPEEAQNEAQMDRVAGQFAKQAGTYYAGEMRPPGTTGPGAKPVNRVPWQSTPTQTPFTQRVPLPESPTLEQRTGRQLSDEELERLRQQGGQQ